MLTPEALQLLLVDLTEQVDRLAMNLRQVRETVDMVRRADRLPTASELDDTYVLFVLPMPEG